MTPKYVHCTIIYDRIKFFFIQKYCSCSRPGLTKDHYASCLDLHVSRPSWEHENKLHLNTTLTHFCPLINLITDS